jgi:tryptophan synthase alpha chain
MSKIKNAFDHGKAFVAFLSAGDPSVEKTIEYVLEMEKAGADLIEIGIPFSDPIADGPVIQAANLRAFAAGISLEKIFDMVTEIRKQTQIPIVFLTYLNPVFHYGYEAFMERCAQCGVDGMIIPDLPIEEKKEVSEVATKYDVDIISMIAPTSMSRIQQIAQDASGFIYVVSSMGITGMRNEIETDLSSIIAAIREVTDVPTAIGFGINTPQQAKDMAAYADGAIVGSAIVKIIEEHGENAAKPLYDYVKSMKEAIEIN